MVIFENEICDICEDIYKGCVEICCLVVEKVKNVGLDLVIGKNVFYFIDLMEGKSIMICILGLEKLKGIFEVYFGFELIDGELKEVNLENGKIVDVCKEKSEFGLNIMICDVEMGNFVIVNIFIVGIKDIVVFYSVFDVFMNVDCFGKL